MWCYLLAHDQPKQTHESYFISWIIPRFSSFHTVQAMDTKEAVAWLQLKRWKDSQEVSRRRPLCEWTRRLLQNYVWYFLGWNFWNRRKVWEKAIWQDIKVISSILHFKSETVSVSERCNIYVKTEQKCSLRLKSNFKCWFLDFFFSGFILWLPALGKNYMM